MPSNAKLFLDHLRGIFGDEDAIHQADAKDGGCSVSVFVYKDVPDTGMITGVTYGLSLCPHPDWKVSRPEMIVSVQSHDLAWPLAAAVIAATFRGNKAFRYGDVFTTDSPLAPDTKMNGFLVFAQSILHGEEALVSLNDYDVHFSQFYPIHQEELTTYEQIGLEAFWNHESFDMYDVARKPIKA